MYVSMSRLRVPAERSDELVMVSRWRDRDAFKAYMKSADHRRSHDRIPVDLDEAITLEALEHLHTYEVVAR